MQQSNASSFNINNLGGAAEAKQNVMDIMSVISTGEYVVVTDVQASGLDPVGFVSVKPLVLRSGADNNTVALGEVHNIPYFRLQGGKNAVIIDPEIGDIGFCGVASRDTSLFKRVRKLATQNVYRVSDISDSFYIGGWSDQTPEQYVWFNGNNLILKARGKIILDAPEVEIPNGSLTVAGIIKSLTDVIAKVISLFSHRHGGVQSGSSTTDAPQ